MWKALTINQRSLLRLLNSQNSKRTFLSESYRCSDAWNERLQSPLLNKVNANEMFLELDQKFQTLGKASAVDVDIYANLITDSDHVDELVDVLHKLRLSAETSNTLDSTHHAVIRYLLEHDKIDDLLTILHDRMNYGIFPDYLMYNILMDDFLKKQDYAAAAKVAVLLMLQEDSENPITNALAIYSCHKYLENPESWKAPEPEPVDTGEEIKVRVAYLRNPFFDDHFDLVEPSDLVGKTLVFYGKSMDDTLGRSCRLRGLIMWKKYGEALDLIREWSKIGAKECIYEEAFSKIQEHLSGLPEDKITDEIKELKNELVGLDKGALKDGNVIDEIENRVKAAVEQQAEIDIADQCRNYQVWEKTRMTVLQNQLAELDKKSRLDTVEQMKKELFERERLLTYFEKRPQVELQISTKLYNENRLYGKPQKTSADIEAEYVPPEIIRRRT